MSFQHFRLGELALQQPLPPHLANHQGTANNANGASTSTFSSQINHTNNSFANDPPKSNSASKQPYGSGDTDDGYTLVFPNIDAFQEWRTREEEQQMVEFVKGDTHGSKAIPPRFKDHTKLVCARHSRSGRKKYVKKHPERVRKVPSRKLEGVGCPASISYKTYFDNDEVRACYISQHSHEIGLANLPFTRRGRKATVQQDKEQSQKDTPSANGNTEPPTTPASTSTNTMAAPPPTIQPPNVFTSAVSMLAPLPGHQPLYQPPPVQPFAYSTAPQQYPTPLPPPVVTQPGMSHDRWENMATLFHSIREHARGFEYPAVSVAALETILIRLYLESPVGGLGTQPTMTTIVQNGLSQQRPPQAARCSTSTNPDGIGGGGEETP